MASRGGSARTGSAAARHANGAAEQLELPSGKYNGIPEPSPVLLQRAAEPPHPVLPRQTAAKVFPPTMREQVPLAASLTGSGRAGKVGCLKGSRGSRYVGQVLAGRPHGQGKCFVQAAQPGRPMRLEYDGEFVKGVRQGSGTCWFSNGEVYTGSWQANQRHGAGKLVHADGSTWYEGAWRADRRNGVGTLHTGNGDVFVGTFVDDKREGLGTTFMPRRGKKYVAEYMNDTASCGSFFELCDDDVEPPPSQQLRSTIMSHALEQAAAGRQQPQQLPVLQLMQPSKVLSKGFVGVRRERQLTPAQAAAVQGSGHTLTADSVDLLRHAFILIASGDDLAAYVRPHQLQELVVLAGFDPASEPVVRLVQQLTAHGSSSPAGDGRLSLDQFLHVVVHFREQQLAVVSAASDVCGGGSHSLLLQPAADAAAASSVIADDAEAAVREEHWLPDESVGAQEASLQFLQQQQQPAGEVSGQPAEQELAGCVSSSSWGAATHDDMLAKHIADHQRPSTPPPAAVAVTTSPTAASDEEQPGGGDRDDVAFEEEDTSLVL